MLSAPFLVAFETQNFVNNRRNWWSMDPPPQVKFLLALRFVFRTQQHRLNCVDVFISMRSASAAARRLTTVPNFTIFVQPLFINAVINCQALWPLHSCRLLIKILSSLLSGVKVATSVSKFALFSVSDLKDEKLIKKQTYMKTETCKLYSRDFWIFLPNTIKIDPYNFEVCFSLFLTLFFSIGTT